MKRAKPTIRQKVALNNLTEAIASKTPFTMGQIMVKSGFSPATAVNPEKNLLSKPGWKFLLAKIDDQEVLARVYSIAKDTTDKRACLAGADMIFKLKDRYPAGKLKVTEYQEELSQY